jgi:putative DNA primase/helicase
MFGDLRGLLAVESYVRGEDGTLRRRSRRVKHFDYPEETEEARGWAFAQSAAGREVYFCAHLLTKRERKKDNASSVLCLWADADRAEYDGASAVVRTSPGKRQVYIRLDSQMDPGEAEKLNHRLTDTIGADSGGWNLARILRVPGTVNRKYPDTPRVEIEVLRPDWRFTRDALDEWLDPLDPSHNGSRSRRETRSGEPPGGEPPVALRGEALKIWRGELPKYSKDDPGRVDRSRTLMSIGRILFDAGATRPTIVPALEERDRSLGFETYLDRPHEYDRIVDKLEHEGRNERVNMGGPPRGSRNGSQEEPQEEPQDGTGDESEEAEERTQEESQEESQSYELTDAGNAFRFVRRFGNRVRYCYPFKKFLIFDGKRWVIDPGGRAVRMAVQVARDIHHEAAQAVEREAQKRIARWAVSSQSEAKISAMLRLARSYLEIDPMELDRDPLLFNCPNGTIDLRTGKRRDHNREDYLTKMSSVEWDPDASAERFERFLEEIFEGEHWEDLTGFVRRYAGSSLSGLTRDRAFVILYGSGKNGKTTLLELLRHVMGDYAQDTPIESLMQKKYEGVGNDIAGLRGARFVTSSESDKGTKLAIAKIKKLVGSDTVKARFLFQEFFEFKPELKLWIATNHKPIIDETTPAIWDRVHLLPFEVRFEGEGEDNALLDKLLEEAPGVLVWLVSGFLEWQRDGLGPPKAVQAATDEYRREMDPVGRFLDEQCEVLDGVAVRFSALWERWEEWAQAEEEDIGTPTAMGLRLRQEGFTKDKSGSVSYLGLQLKKKDK